MGAGFARARMSIWLNNEAGSVEGVATSKRVIGECRETTFLFKSGLCSWLTCLLSCLALWLFSLASNTSYFVDAELCGIVVSGGCLGRTRCSKVLVTGQAPFLGFLEVLQRKQESSRS